MLEIRRRIIDEARSWVDTPAGVHQHRAKGVACDCPGPLTMTTRALGLSDFDITDYDRLPDGQAMLALCDREMTRIEVRDMQPGDAVVMKFVNMPQHIGILADHPFGGLSLIHASNTVGKVVEHSLAPSWRSRIVAAYRLPGVPADGEVPA